MKLLLARHGETEWNAQGRSQGHSDIPLNGNGLHQAKRLAERLSAIKLTGVYCSDLGRARETAGVVIQGRDGLEPGVRAWIHTVAGMQSHVVAGPRGGKRKR